MKKREYLFVLMVLFISFSVNAQKSEQKEKSAKKEKKLSIIPLPAIAYNPTNGWLMGVAPGASWFMGDASNTSISSGLGTLIYTSKKQFLFTAKTNVFLDDDSWNLMGDWRYFITSQPTYGLGSGPQTAKPVGNRIEFQDGLFNSPIPDEQMMDFNYLRFHETGLKRIQDSRYFVGLGYHLDIHSKIEDNFLDLDAEEPVITSHYAYQTLKGFSTEKYTLSGISFNALLDSRDNAINSYSGRYAFVNLRINPEFLGSDKSSTLLWLEYRDYLHLDPKRPRHLIGFWTYGWFVTSGDVPYLDLPAVGWDQFGRSGRAYTQGRIRGEDLVYGEVEYRFPLQKNKETFGGVVFVNTTTASNRTADINLFKYMDFAYGTGLRIMINKKSRANLSLDYAVGKHGASGFYFGINEVF
ncbi:BamA/TamA family outer membrane protein [Prolixibacteraceae bacterium Z1-6]|uniref:BamA/TamA family outer membrane protein n=1 Tax=Draconibacterium aestuarii TaxID=2998507 RepID=A0A9X3F7N8_9BACT|nr:BamA/TamA family outer membrane protein [Prolixibacteraceae bacterium Z1-6]